MHKPTLTLRRLALVALMLTVGAALLRFVPGPEPWPDWYRRLVRRTNPIAYRLGLVGGRRSPLASVEHVGRKSGTLRRTPVWAFVTSDHVIVGLPYGRDVNWVRKNVMASGHCRIQIHSQVYELDEPQVRGSAELPERARVAQAPVQQRDGVPAAPRLRRPAGTLDSVRPVEGSEAHRLASKPDAVADEAALA